MKDIKNTSNLAECENILVFKRSWAVNFSLLPIHFSGERQATAKDLNELKIYRIIYQTAFKAGRTDPASFNFEMLCAWEDIKTCLFRDLRLWGKGRSDEEKLSKPDFLFREEWLSLLDFSDETPCTIKESEYLELSLIRAALDYRFKKITPDFEQKELNYLFSKVIKRDIDQAIENRIYQKEVGRLGGRPSKLLDKHDVYKDYENGATQEQLAEKYKVHQSTVSRWLKEYEEETM